MKNFLGNFFNSVLNFIVEVFSGQTGLWLNEVLEIGLPIIKVLSEEDLPNNIKKEMAFKQIKEIIMEKRLDIADHVINLAIEMIVARGKK